jgi:hypothetical protein
MSYDPNQQPYPPTRPMSAPPPYTPVPPQYGPPPGQFTPKRAAKWPYLVLAAAVLFLASGVWTLYDQGLILKDSGVKACEALAGKDKAILGVQNGKKAPLTEQRYKLMRGVFADSRYDDIRNHGTKLMDLVWQIEQLGDDPGMGAVAYMGPMMDHLTGLQSACADQGVTVTLRS